MDRGDQSAGNVSALVESSLELLGPRGGDARLQMLCRLVVGSINPQELAAVSRVQLARAVEALWSRLEAISSSAPSSLGVLPARDFGETGRLKVVSRTETEDDRNTACIAAVTPDIAFLVDTMTEAISSLGYRTTFVLHPLLPGETLAAANPFLQGTVEDYSLFYAEIEEGLTEIEMSQLRQEVSAAYLGLQDIQRALPSMKETLGVLCDRLSGINYLDPEIIVGTMGLTNFLPTSYVRVRGDGQLEGSGCLKEDAFESALDGLGVSTVVYHQNGVLLRAGTSALKSTVIRRSRLRYFRFEDESAGVSHLFFGLFAPSSLGRPFDEIPHFRRKVQDVVHSLGLSEASYAYRSTVAFVSSLAPDELFCLTSDDLAELVSIALSVEEVPRLRLYLQNGLDERPESPRRVYLIMPSARFSEALVSRLGREISEYYGGAELEVSSVATGTRRGQVCFLLTNSPTTLSESSVRTLEARLEQVSLPWEELLRLELISRFGHSQGQELFQRYSRCFEASYLDDFSPTQGADDLIGFHRLITQQRSLVVSLASHSGGTDLAGGIRLRILRLGEWMLLSEILPVVENFGFKVVDELPYGFDFEGREGWVFDLGLRFSDAAMADTVTQDGLDRARDAMLEIWENSGEDDVLNGLTLTTKLSHRAVSVLRALSSYLRFTILGFSESYIRGALRQNPEVASLLYDLFHAKLGPGDSEWDATSVDQEIANALGQVDSLDQDKILRGIQSLIHAVVRTNFFSQDQVAGISIKLAPDASTGLPKPLPHHEIYYRSLSTEAVHLRGGSVARGGIRWSDRSEDFRTEVLGLMKAQAVKNSVIVPVGAKGGFVVRNPPRAREELQERVVASYREFIEGLFGLTDNIVDGEVVHPLGCSTLDGNDPYLVVAADKGTATFSDIANDISESHGFWLGDAFASGGSSGYDHKKMGITAKGAWKSVEHHLGFLGVVPAIDPISVVGIGDMSGDVFGNAMLLSSSLLLVAAFDHRDIFIDPRPDAVRSYQERARLFQLERSSWKDYSRDLISEGGGVFPRSLKEIELSPAAAGALGVGPGLYEPSQVIRFILESPVDLLWNGGVGTFIKATSESDLDVSDKTNDLIRVNAGRVRARVIGEGGNLGMTQLARSEFCSLGGRCNSDAIDNSAGVDTSDHEVNLKILLSTQLRSGEISLEERDRLLAAVESDVEAQVLADNVLQNWAISLAEASLPRSSTAFLRLNERLIRDAELDCAVEQTPTPQDMIRRFAEGGRLYRPELAVLLAYAKIHLFKQLLDSDIVDEEIARHRYEEYFPQAIRTSPNASTSEHPLRREITATVLSNLLLNTVGMTAIFELCDLASISVSESAAAILCALEISSGANHLWKLAGETAAPQGDRVGLLRRQSGAIFRLARWIVTSLPPKYGVTNAVREYRPSFEALLKSLPELLDEAGSTRLEGERKALEEIGIGTEVASYFCAIDNLASLPAIIQLSRSFEGLSAEQAAIAYFWVGAAVTLPSLRLSLVGVPTEGYWQESSRELLFVGLNEAQLTLCRSSLSSLCAQGAHSEARSDLEAALEAWKDHHSHVLDRISATIAQLSSQANASLSQLHVITAEVGLLARSISN